VSATPRTTVRKEKIGRVVSDKMDKTIVVSVERLSRHPLYKRVIRLTTKFKAHDERNEARIGDTVRIVESRPLSATKRWRMVEIVQRGDVGAGEPWWLKSRQPATRSTPLPIRAASGRMRRPVPRSQRQPSDSATESAQGR